MPQMVNVRSYNVERTYTLFTYTYYMSIFWALITVDLFFGWFICLNFSVSCLLFSFFLLKVP